jgi:hypothetical protein
VTWRSLTPALGLLGLFALVALIALIGRWRAARETGPAVPASPAVDPYRRSSCRYCKCEATRYEPTIVEHHGAAELLSRLMPIGLVPTRYRRTLLYAERPVLCELHGSLAERAVDQFLADEASAFARALRQRAQRARLFLADDLPKLLRGEP